MRISPENRFMKCERCGIEIEKRGNRQRYCRNCKMIVHQENLSAAKDRYAKRKENKHKRINGSLVDIAMKAKEAGMSYGEYVARMDYDV